MLPEAEEAPLAIQRLRDDHLVVRDRARREHGVPAALDYTNRCLQRQIASVSRPAQYNAVCRCASGQHMPQRFYRERFQGP